MAERPVLVLGGTGFLGGAVVRALRARGTPVRVMARPTSPREALGDVPGIDWVTGDLRDPASLRRAAEGVRAIVHAAGHYPTSALRPRETMRRGVTEMRHVLDATRSAGARLVYLSSLSTVGKVEGRPANEADLYLPGSVDDPYFEVKHAMEREALGAAAEGLDVVVVNPGIVLGPGDVKPTSGRLVLSIARERLPVAIDAPVSIIDVRDMADAVVASLDRGKTGERYILSGENLTMRELWRRIAHGTGVRSPLMVPPGVARRISLATEYVAFAGDLASRPFRRRAPWLARRLRRPPLIPLEGVSIISQGQPLDSSKAREELGLSPRPLEDTLRDTIQWFRDEGYAL